MCWRGRVGGRDSEGWAGGRGGVGEGWSQEAGQPRVSTPGCPNQFTPWPGRSELNPEARHTHPHICFPRYCSGARARRNPGLWLGRRAWPGGLCQRAHLQREKNRSSRPRRNLPRSPAPTVEEPPKQRHSAHLVRRRARPRELAARMAMEGSRLLITTAGPRSSESMTRQQRLDAGWASRK